MNYNAEKDFERAVEAVELAQYQMRQAMNALFNAAASRYYLSHTARSWAGIVADGWLASAQYNDWSRDCQGDEWADPEECISCAEEAAGQYITKENGIYTLKRLVNIYDDDACSFERYFAKQITGADPLEEPDFHTLSELFSGRYFEIIPNASHIKFNGKLNSDFKLREVVRRGLTCR